MKIWPDIRSWAEMCDFFDYAGLYSGDFDKKHTNTSMLCTASTNFLPEQFLLAGGTMF
jgi:hypothetical protein